MGRNSDQKQVEVLLGILFEGPTVVGNNEFVA